MNRNILMIIAPENFKEAELLIPQIIFEEDSYTVYIGSENTASAVGTEGKIINIDKHLSEIQVENYAAIIFIGGSGAKVYFDNKIVHKLARDAYQQNKIIGAICIAPSILANAEILIEKNVTAFASEKENIISKGANFIDKDVVVDKNIVTANGPYAAKEFATEIIKLLQKQLI